MKYLRPLIYAVFIAVAVFFALDLSQTFAPFARIAIVVVFAGFAAFLADVLVTVLAEKISPLSAARQVGEHLLADAHQGETQLVSDFRHLEAGVLTELDALEEKGKLLAGTVASTVESYFGIKATPAVTPAASTTAAAVPAAAAPAPAAPVVAAEAPAAAPVTLNITGTSDQVAAIANALQSSNVSGVNIIHSNQ